MHITEHASPCRISIHALLAESDTTRHISPLTQSHFYPRSPCGERPCGNDASQSAGHHFYPRSPCGERRCKTCGKFGLFLFLSTLSLRRATINGLRHRWASFYFYPRSPCGERHIHAPNRRPYHYFYPRSPCGERLHRTVNI